jgi:hypothetical protein
MDEKNLELTERRYRAEETEILRAAKSAALRMTKRVDDKKEQCGDRREVHYP